LLSEIRTNVSYPWDRPEKQGRPSAKMETREGRVRLFSDASTGSFSLEVYFSQTTRRKETEFERHFSGQELQDILEWGEMEDKRPAEQYAWLLTLAYIRHTDNEENGSREKSCVGLKGYDQSVTKEQVSKTLLDEKLAIDFKDVFSAIRDRESLWNGIDQEQPQDVKMREDSKNKAVRLACARHQMDWEVGMALNEWYSREKGADSFEHSALFRKLCRASGRADAQDESSINHNLSGFVQFVEWLCLKFPQIQTMSAYDVRRFADLVDREDQNVKRRQSNVRALSPMPSASSWTPFCGLPAGLVPPSAPPPRSSSPDASSSRARKV